jgi:hypothetical protein
VQCPDFGIAMRPCCMCQRTMICAVDLAVCGGDAGDRLAGQWLAVVSPGECGPPPRSWSAISSAATVMMRSRPLWDSNLGSLAADYGCPVSQWDAEAVKALRSAVYNGDGSVVGVVCGRLTGDVPSPRM